MKDFWIALWRLLNIVHPYQAIVYLGLCGWGIYSLGAREQIVISSTMSATIYHLWVAMHMLGPAVVWTGQFLHAGVPTPKRTLLGWELQAAGDAAIFFIVTTTAYAFWQSNENGAPYIIAVFASWSVCAIMLSLRDLIAVVYYFGCCHKKRFDADVLH